jgi:MarR family transcriptional regulator, temperature-dependent positive regulator of motility
LTEEQADRLHELADLIHAVARQLVVPADLRPGLCTPVEISVMRFVSQNPGTSARMAANATLLPSSNFSRIVKGLISKGLLRREADKSDARIARLHPTELAKANSEQMRAVWNKALEDIVPDPATMEIVNDTLRRIEAALILRSIAPARAADR